MANFVQKMVPGYAYASMKTFENVIVSQSDCGKAIFIGFVEFDGNEYSRFRFADRNRYQLSLHTQSMRQRAFTMADCESIGSWDGLRISADRSELLDSPTSWQLRGLSETATGYGKALNSGLMVWFEGKFRRIYTTIFSNSGTSWFRYKDKKIVIG